VQLRRTAMQTAATVEKLEDAFEDAPRSELHLTK
jgi:hypothetical protein